MHTCAGLRLRIGESGHWATSAPLALELAARGQLSADTAKAVRHTSALPEPAVLAEPCQVELPAIGGCERHRHNDAEMAMQSQHAPVQSNQKQKAKLERRTDNPAAKQYICTPWMSFTASTQDAQHGGNCPQQHLPVILDSAFQVAHSAACGLWQLWVFSGGASAADTHRPAAGAHLLYLIQAVGRARSSQLLVVHQKPDGGSLRSLRQAAGACCCMLPVVMP